MRKHKYAWLKGAIGKCKMQNQWDLDRTRPWETETVDPVWSQVQLHLENQTHSQAKKKKKVPKKDKT